MTIALKRGLKFDNFIAFIFALRAVTFVWLAFASNEYSPLFANAVNILRYITIPLGLLYLLRNKNINYNNIILLIPLIFYFMMLVVNTYGGYKGSYLHELISIGIFLLMSKKEKKQTFKYFYYIVLVSCSISIILYIVYMLGLKSIFKTVGFYNDGVLSSYYKQFFVFAIMDGGFSIPRLCGIFNEPGGLGTVCALLFAAVYKKTGNIQKIILLLSLVFSFSLGGYVLVSVYFLLLSIIEKRWKLICFAVLLVILFFVLPHIDFHNEFLNEVFARFKITNFELAGNNRTSELFDAEFLNFIKSSDVFLGKGATYGLDLGSSSYKNLVLQFGILGTGLFFVLWLFIAFYCGQNNKYCIILLIVFIISLYQRPVALTNSYGYVVLFGSFSWLTQKEMTINQILVNGGLRICEQTTS